jgi:hypothetical protein
VAEREAAAGFASGRQENHLGLAQNEAGHSYGIDFCAAIYQQYRALQMRKAEQFCSEASIESRKRVFNALSRAERPLGGAFGSCISVFPPFKPRPAEMIGTTRSRVSFFMNRLRILGFIERTDEPWFASRG